MRWVILIATIAFFLIWDGLKNDGQYLDKAVGTVRYLVHKID